ncbi:MAG: HD domain-containing phosphohydrolase [Bacillota bacterium]
MPYNKRELSNIPVETINKWKEASKTVADLVDKNVVIITRDRPDFFAILISRNQLAQPLAIDELLKKSKDFTYELEWPDGRLFGAIILMDKEQNCDFNSIKNSFKIIKDMIEADLKLIINNKNLAEREKELACIYQISQLLLDNNLELEEVLLEITKILPRHFAYPELARCRIIYNSLIISEGLEKPTGKKLVEEIELTDEDYLRIEIFYDYNRKKTDIEFLAEEKQLLASVVRHAATIIRRINIEQALVETRNELYTTLYSIGDGVITTDLDGRITMMNFTAKKMTGWSYSEARGRPLAEVFKIENARTGQKIISPAEKVIKEGRKVGLANDTTLISKTGKRYQIADSAAPIKDFNNEITGVILVFSDVTEEYKYRKNLKLEREWLESIFQTGTDPIAKVDEQHRVIDINDRFTEVFKYQLSEIKGMNLDDVMDRSKSDTADRKVTEELLEGKQVETEATRYDKYGDPKECLIRGIPVIVDDELVGGYGIYIDITERKRQEDKIKYMSYHDRLTGLYNRAYLEEKLNEVNSGDKLFSILMLDVNGLKFINDSYGHEIGDKMLLKVSGALQNIFREQDKVVRWSGDEFVVLMSAIKEKEIEKRVDRLRNLNLEVNISNGESLPVSLAVGFDTPSDSEVNIYDILHNAEDKMYQDKLLSDKSSTNKIVKSLLSTLHEKSQETESHAERMEELAIKLGEKVGLSYVELNRLSLLAVLHDIGKTTIPESILKKPGSLTDAEWVKIKQHPVVGFRLCSSIDDFSHIALDVLSHHERWDGTGYPRGIAGENIPLLARIITIVDSFDVMTNGRPYKEPMTEEEALEEIKNCARTQFDPELARKFIEIFE